MRCKDLEAALSKIPQETFLLEKKDQETQVEIESLLPQEPIEPSIAQSAEENPETSL